MSKWSSPSPHLIRRYRILAGMTLAQSAEVLKTSASRVCLWENGKHVPTPRSLTKLANAYKCDITDFYEADVETVRTLATNVIVGYFNDTEANPDRKAQVASHLLTQLPDTQQPDDDDNSKTLDDVLLDDAD